MLWQHNERQDLIKIARKHGLRIENPNEHREHVDTAEYVESKSGKLRELNQDIYEELYLRLMDVSEEQDDLSRQKELMYAKEEELSLQRISQEQKEQELIQIKEIIIKKNFELNKKEHVIHEAVHVKEEAEEQLTYANSLIDSYEEHHKNALKEVEMALSIKIKRAEEKTVLAERKFSDATDAYQRLKNESLELDRKTVSFENQKKEFEKSCMEKEKTLSQKFEDVLVKAEKLKSTKQRFSDLFHKVKTLLKEQKRDLKTREDLLVQEKTKLETSKVLAKETFEKNMQYKDLVVKMYSQAPEKIPVELNIAEAFLASKYNNSSKLMTWFKSVESKIGGWLQKVQYTAKHFFKKSPDEMLAVVDSMNKNKAANFSDYIEMKMHGKTIEQIELKERSEKLEKDMGMSR